MSTSKDDIRVRIAGDLADIRRSMDDLKKQTRAAGREARKSRVQWRQLGRGLDNVRRQVRGLVGAYLGFRAIQGTIRGVIRNTLEQERVTAQLEARIKSTGGAAGLTADELLGMASGLQQVTTFGDEAITGMQSLLLTFTQIRGEVFEDATTAILDMAVALDEKLQSSATRVGKALNDPIRGISELREVGIGFTNQQIELVKQLTETGDIVGAQRVILEELEVQFGGAAAAARETFGGALQSLGNAFGDLLEGRGGNVNDAKDAINDLTELLQDPATIEAFNTITAAIVRMTGVLARASTHFVTFGERIGEAFARALGAGTPIDRAAERIEALENQLRSLDSSRPDHQFLIERINAEIELLQAQAALNEDLQRGREAARARSAGEGAGDDRREGGAVTVDGRPALQRLAAELDAAGAMLNDELKRLGESLDRAFEDNLVRFSDYFERRAELETRAIDQQIETQRNALAILDEDIKLTRQRGEATEEAENKRAKLVADIIVLERQRADVVNNASLEKAEAERDLAEQLDQVRIRLLRAQGQTAEARTAQLENEFRDLLARLRVEGDSEGEALVQRLFDVELARAQLQEIEAQYQRSLSELSRQEQRVQALVDTGTITEREGRRRIVALHQETADEVEQLIPLMRELAEATGDPAAIERLRELELEVESLRRVTDRTVQEFKDSVRDAGENAFASFISGAQSARDAWDDFVDNVRLRAAQLLAEGILDRIAEALRSSGSGSSGSGGGFFAQLGTLLAGVLHDGGIAGRATQHRRVPAIAFAGAPRLHNGGFAPGEMPAILKRDEEVLTRRDPRHRANLRGGDTYVTIETQDARSFQRMSRGQIASQLGNELVRASNRNR